MILLDTHVLVWMSSEPKRLTRRAREAIRAALAWLANSGRLQITGSVESYVRETASRVIVRPITPEISSLAVQMPANFPKDPADRMIVATAAVEGLALVTADDRIHQANRVQTIW